MIYKKALSTHNLLTAIRESWNQFDGRHWSPNNGMLSFIC